MIQNVLGIARRYRQLGFSPIPIRADGSKAPPVSWTLFQRRAPTEDELRRLFGDDNRLGIGLVCGAVAGNLEVLDFEAVTVADGLFDAFLSLCADHGLQETAESLVWVKTPSGGMHLYLRCDEPVEANQKLAQRAIEVPEGTPGARKIAGRWVKIKTLVETRGEGGYVLAEGSPPECHPKERPYTVVRGDMKSVPTIPAAHRLGLLAMARVLNEFAEEREIVGGSAAARNGHLRPGDIYNQQTTWGELLPRYGWESAGHRAGMGLWRRPGKEGPGISATTGYGDSDLLYVFSTSAYPLESCRAYDRFAFYATMEHGVDFAAAAKALAEQGYRVPESERRSTPEADAGNAGAAEGKKPSTAQRLIEIGLGGDVELFHSEREEPFARVRVEHHRENRSLRSRWFRAWLAGRHFEETGRPAGGQAIEDALRTLEAKALVSNLRRPLEVRIAQDAEGALWLDLCDAEWRAVRIMPTGWEIVAEPPAYFRRYAALAPQVEPARGGSLQALRSFLNIASEEAWHMTAAWLVAAFFPNIARPVLVVYGEQGSAKSTEIRLLSLLIDPSLTSLRSEPRDLGEWVQAADHGQLIALDNVSVLPTWLSDAICRAVTGEGFSKRMLYSDSDDVIVAFRRVVALTGIEIVAQKSDLLDRAVLHGLEPIAPEARRPETEALAEFDRARPAILGALLDTLAGVLRELPTVHLAEHPRMADFARVGVAVERVLGWPTGAFLAAYGGNIGSQHDEAIAASPIGEAVRAFAMGQSTWTGSASELLKELNAARDGGPYPPQGWPKIPNKLSGLLQRIAPNLRAVGINVAFDKTNGARVITIRTEA